jgi:hypothetical protein
METELPFDKLNFYCIKSVGLTLLSPKSRFSGNPYMVPNVGAVLSGQKTR